MSLAKIANDLGLWGLSTAGSCWVWQKLVYWDVISTLGFLRLLICWPWNFLSRETSHGGHSRHLERSTRCHHVWELAKVHGTHALRDVLPVVTKVSSLLVLSASATTLVKSLVWSSAATFAGLSLDLLSELSSDVRAHHLEKRHQQSIELSLFHLLYVVEMRHYHHHLILHLRVNSLDLWPWLASILATTTANSARYPIIRPRIGWSRCLPHNRWVGSLCFGAVLSLLRLIFSEGGLDLIHRFSLVLSGRHSVNQL